MEIQVPFAVKINLTAKPFCKAFENFSAGESSLRHARCLLGRVVKLGSSGIYEWFPWSMQAILHRVAI